MPEFYLCVDVFQVLQILEEFFKLSVNCEKKQGIEIF